MAENNLTGTQIVDNTFDIDLFELFGALKKRALVIIAAMILGTVLFGGYSKYFVEPTYTSKATLYLFEQKTDVISSSDLQMGSQIASDFTVLATSEPVVNKMLEAIGSTESYEGVVGRISAVNTSGTRLIVITINDHDPQKAQEMTDALAEALVERVTEIMGTSRAYIAVPASTPRSPSAPNIKKNAIKGAVLGFLVIAGIVTLQFVIDDTIKTSADVERYLGLATFAEIPIDYSADDKKKKKSGKKAR